MLCEKCHQEDALVHITEIEGAGRDEAAPIVKRDFCEACGQEYQREIRRFLELCSPCLHEGMSKEQRAQAMQEFRDRMRGHMADWVAGRLPQ